MGETYFFETVIAALPELLDVARDELVINIGPTPADVLDGLGGCDVILGTDAGGPAPLHRRGRFKRNARKARAAKRRRR